MNKSGLILILFLTAFHSYGKESWILYPRDQESIFLAGLQYSSQLKMNLKRRNNQCDSLFDFICDYALNTRKNDFKSKDIVVEDQVKLIYIGERHKDLAPKKWANQMMELKSNKIKVLFFEMFNHSSQDKLDQFFREEITENEIEQVLKSQWTHDSRPYIEMLKVAKKNHIRVIGIDHRDIFEGQKLELSQELELRDILMSRVINSELKDEFEGRAIVYTGKLHAFRTFGSEVKTIAELVSKAHPEIVSKHYLATEVRSRNILSDLFHYYMNDSKDIADHIFKSEALFPYVDGVFLFRDR
jgi:hypothetical protein